MILIITCSFDETVDYIIQKLKQPFFRLNVDEFPRYSINVNENGWSIVKDNHEIDNKIVQSVYYRKPYLPDLTSYEMQYREMIANDIIYLIKGIATASNCKMLTCPFVLQKAENKLYQMFVAQKVGFLMAKTLITNSNDHAESFVKKGKTVIKPISTGKIAFDNTFEIYNTSLINNTEFDIELTPVFLQKYVKKDYEVRAYVIGEKDYSVKIIASNNVDWRLDEEKNHYERICLPTDIKEKCLKFMTGMGLFFGAFDFIVYQGEWFFLENNPNGQWLWLEEKLGLGISNEIVNYLEK